MSAPRQFVAREAVREQVPVLVGLMGASGSGKTYSALRLASGMQRITGGDICVIDTESRRSLHYADHFKFKHVEFGEPFASLDYLAALQQQVSGGAKVIIVDSMSHEHEGPGGYLDLHEQILDRRAGEDWKKREAMNMLAWVEPKQQRRAMINGILRLNANFIFCFRAGTSAKPVKVGGKTEIVQQGYVAISGKEMIYEMTMAALLMPGSGGVPTWQSEEPGERMAIKLPRQFAGMKDMARPLDEDMGQSLAEWARGKAPAAELTDAERDRLAKLEAGGYDAADMGLSALAAFWKSLSKADQAHFAEIKDSKWKPRAEASTAAAA